MRLLLCLLLLLPCAAFAQTTDHAYTFVEQMPVFRGTGLDSLPGYLQRHLRYPAEALQQRLSGRVFVRFEVQPDGQVAAVELAKGLHPALDTEALRLVASLPRWEQPGRQNARAVRVQLTVPVLFQLQAAVPGVLPYDGPFFPFGPDSLRRFLAWSARHSSYPTLYGRYVLRLPLAAATGQPDWEHPTPLVSATELRANRDLLNALRELLRPMPRWRPGLPGAPASATLAVYLGEVAPSPALPYADFMPAFPDGPGTTTALSERLTARLRQQQPQLRGTATVYLEIDEAGRPTQAQLLQASRPALGAAVLQAATQLPQALASAQFRGQAARVYYVLEVAL